MEADPGVFDGLELPMVMKRNGRHGGGEQTREDEMTFKNNQEIPKLFIDSSGQSYILSGNTVNITKIAQASGISVTTVSRVLNHDDGVDEVVRQKTLKVIERSGYRPRKNIRRGTRLGVVVRRDAPSFNAFFSCVFAGVAAYATEAEIDFTLIHYTPPSLNGTQSLADVLRKKRCNGAILLSMLEDQDVISLREAQIPIVLVAYRTEEEGVGYIDCNCFKGAYEQTLYLLRQGHRRIGFLCGELKGIVDHQERLGGFQKAMREAGISVSPDLIVPHKPAGLSELAGYNQTRTLLNSGCKVTAIFATNDLMAYGAICYCTEHGLRVPEDLSVVGYDDTPTSRFYNPPLTTTRQPLREMGFDAAKAVDLKLQGKIDRLPTDLIENELIARRSCAAPSRETPDLAAELSHPNSR